MGEFKKLELRIGWLYPSLMSTYGDRGNLIALQQRSRWRGIDVRVARLNEETSAADWRRVDLFVGGGAQDREQEIVMRDLAGAKAAALRARIEDGVPGVFTCGSLQLLGNYYEPAEGTRIEGLGVLDLWTAHPGPDAQRCIGNIVFEVTPQALLNDLAPWAPSPLLAVGFENHGGRTFLGRVEPLGRVRRGFGNNGQDGTEGAFYRHSMATYSHGPLLPKNPFLADWLIQTALRQKYGANFHLDPLNDGIAEQARATMFERLRVRAPAPPLEKERAA